MAPSFLIAGATGNTGRGVVETLSKLLETNRTFAGYQILALTRSSTSSTAQQLAKCPNVKVIEQNWVELTADWFRSHEVTRAFIAPHNQPNQLAEESTFHHAALKAGVKYVVRISTSTPNVRPDCDAYYPRSHWAIEMMLSSPEFQRLQWTSLQPNGFSPLILHTATEFIKKFRTEGKQHVLKIMPASDVPAGLIDPQDVGVFAAHLLVQSDTSVHNQAKYTMNGPEDVTGKQIVMMVEERIGTKVEAVVYKDMSLVDGMVAATQESKNVIGSIRHAMEPVWEGKCSASTTSKEVLEIAPPKTTLADTLKMMLGE